MSCYKPLGEHAQVNDLFRFSNRPGPAQIHRRVDPATIEKHEERVYAGVNDPTIGVFGESSYGLDVQIPDPSIESQLNPLSKTIVYKKWDPSDRRNPFTYWKPDFQSKEMRQCKGCGKMYHPKGNNMVTCDGYSNDNEVPNMWQWKETGSLL